MSLMDEEPIIQTNSEGMRCPTCEYDLRGTTEPVCPECGAPFTLTRVAAHARCRWRFERLFRRLLIIPYAWFALYLLSGSTFSGTVDRVSLGWIPFVFLNIPLQLVLTASAHGCLKVDNARTKRWGGILTTILLILVATHVAISLFTV